MSAAVHTFHHRLPAEAQRDTRSVWTTDDRYSLVELYCDDPGCDCRRVVFQVFSEGEARVIGSVGFGWESEAFYRRWASFPLTSREVAELRGPALMRLAPQTERADEALRACELALADPSYVDRIIAHYHAFRRAGSARPRRTAAAQRRRDRLQRLKARRREEKAARARSR